MKSFLLGALVVFLFATLAISLVLPAGWIVQEVYSDNGCTVPLLTILTHVPVNGPRPAINDTCIIYNEEFATSGIYTFSTTLPLPDESDFDWVVTEMDVCPNGTITHYMYGIIGCFQTSNHTATTFSINGTSLSNCQNYYTESGAHCPSDEPTSRDCTNLKLEECENGITATILTSHIMEVIVATITSAIITALTTCTCPHF